MPTSANPHNYVCSFNYYKTQVRIQSFGEISRLESFLLEIFFQSVGKALTLFPKLAYTVENVRILYIGILSNVSFSVGLVD